MKDKTAVAATYFATGGLKNASNVALTLGRPLLITGEPGSGKTSAAYWIARVLGISKERFHVFPVRSDTRAKSLRYDFDAVNWFRQSQIEKKQVDKAPFITPGPLGNAFGWRGQITNAPHLILIDEVDKAPRDFPNDLLLELDEMRFMIVETGEWIGPPQERPIIVITSNAERRLPDPFLRRCISHQIKLAATDVEEILRLRLTQSGSDLSGLFKAAAAFFHDIPDRLTRKPTLAELWQWIALELAYGGVTATEAAGRLTAKGDALRSSFINTLVSPSDLDELAR